MAGLQLTRGGESRLDGAPYQDLPDYAAYVDAVAAKLLAEDADGLLANDRELARERARLIVNAELDAQQQKRAEAQARVAEDYGRRQQDRAQARGVNPESMPYTATASDVRLANRPIEEVSAQLEAEQNAADRVAYALRQDLPPFEAQETLDFLRERGEMNPFAGPGRTDMAMRAAIRERRGQYYEMPDGSRIPVGREPTAAEIRAEREWQDWTNETPGTERQALYNPAGYEEFREGARQAIQRSAREEIERFGGTDRTQWTDEQRARRDERSMQEAARRNAPQAVAMRRMRLEEAAGIDPETAKGMTEDQLRVEAARARLREKKGRRSLVAEQAMMAGGRPTGGPFGTRATTTAINQLGPGWREIALLDRLTQGRVGGPTPLAVEGANAAAAAQMAQQAMVAFLRNNPGATPEQAAAAQQQLRGMNPAAAGGQDIARGQLDTPEAQAEMSRLAESLDTTWGGMSAENEAAMAATLQRPPYNLDQPTAEEMAYRYAQKRRWSGRQRNAPAPEDTGLPPPGSVAPPF